MNKHNKTEASLAQWNHEREEDLRARSTPADREVEESKIFQWFTGKTKPVANSDIKVRQIRLLTAPLVPEWLGKPVVAAVTKDWIDDMVVMALYSPYSVPAVTTELLTEREDEWTKVISGWNVCTTTRELLTESCLLGVMTRQEQIDAWDVFRHAMTGADLPEKLEDRVGLPILVPNDPRVAYQSEQVRLMTPFAHRVMKAVELL